MIVVEPMSHEDQPRDLFRACVGVFPEDAGTTESVLRLWMLLGERWWAGLRRMHFIWEQSFYSASFEERAVMALDAIAASDRAAEVPEIDRLRQAARDAYVVLCAAMRTIQIDVRTVSFPLSVERAELLELFGQMEMPAMMLGNHFRRDDGIRDEIQAAVDRIHARGKAQADRNAARAPRPAKAGVAGA